MRVTLVLPTLNEAEGIAHTLARLPRPALEAAGDDVEVLVVDGDSTDGTRDRAAAAGATVVVERRLGYGRAYKTGLRLARGDWVVTSDADDTYPLDELPALLASFRRERLDFATVDRFARLAPGSMGRRHRFGNRVLSATARVLFGVRVHDSQSGMWILGPRARERLPLERLSDGMAFSQEIKILAFRDSELRCRELPGGYYPRVGEAKLSSWSDGLRNLGGLFLRRAGRLPPRQGRR